MACFQRATSPDWNKSEAARVGVGVILGGDEIDWLPKVSFIREDQTADQQFGAELMISTWKTKQMKKKSQRNKK